MSYVKGTYDNDIFVSYGHCKSESELYSMNRWTIELIEGVKSAINAIRKDSEDFITFIDKDLDKNLSLSDQLRKKAEGSAILIAIMSSYYLSSNWCKDEALWFETQMKIRGRSDGYFFVVRATPTNHASWPPYLKDDAGQALIGYKFHDGPPEPENSDETIWPYGYPRLTPETFQGQYFKELLNLAGAIFKRLVEIRNLEEAVPRQETFLQSVFSPVVYLHAGADGAEVWQQEKGLLEAAGFTVKPDKPPARVTTGLELHELRRQRLTTCLNCAALLILRSENGMSDLHDIVATGHLERMEVEAQLGQRMPCAVVDRTGDLDPHVRRFGIDVLGASGAGLAVELRQWLSSKASANAELEVAS